MYWYKNTHTCRCHARINIYLDILRTCVLVYGIQIHIFVYMYGAQGGEDPKDALSLQVIFRKRATNYRALLRKMIYKDQASYGSMPPCNSIVI